MSRLEHQTKYEALDLLGLVLLHKFLGHLQLSQQRPEIAHLPPILLRGVNQLVLVKCILQLVRGCCPRVQTRSVSDQFQIFGSSAPQISGDQVNQDPDLLANTCP